jgi:hypothetical protein
MQRVPMLACLLRFRQKRAVRASKGWLKIKIRKRHQLLESFTMSFDTKERNTPSGISSWRAPSPLPLD